MTQKTDTKPKVITPCPHRNYSKVGAELVCDDCGTTLARLVIPG